MEERIKQLASQYQGGHVPMTNYEIAKKIQLTLLYDTNQNVPLNFILEQIEK